jgi:hypothetical protein
VSKARVSVFVVVAGMIVASLASSPAWAELLKAADWQMDEASGPMLDSSGNGNNGTPTDVVRTGSNYVFNGSTSRVPVPDADSLDPQADDITLTARVRVGVGEDTTTHQMDDDSYDVVRKGFVTTEGGDYKMEIKRTADPTVGKLHCFFRGDQASVAKIARPDIVDGSWHTLECAKTGTSVTAKVDGRSFTQTGSAGSIDNAINVMVGAKTVDPRPDDMFDGSMDYVSIDIARPDIAQ